MILNIWPSSQSSIASANQFLQTSFVFHGHVIHNLLTLGKWSKTGVPFIFPQIENGILMIDPTCQQLAKIYFPFPHEKNSILLKIQSI